MSLFLESMNSEVQDRQTRLEKIKEALKQLEERKPESESKTLEKDQINFTDPESRSWIPRPEASSKVIILNSRLIQTITLLSG